MVAESHELAYEVSGASLRIDSALVEIRAQVDEASIRIGEEVPDDNEDRALDSDKRLHLAPPMHQPTTSLHQEGVGFPA